FAASMRFFRKTYFSPMNSPYQFMPIGTKDNVAAYTPEQIRQYYSDKIIKPRKVLAIYGDIDIDKARIAVEKNFAATKKAGDGNSAGSIPLSNTTKNLPKPSIMVDSIHINKSPNPQTGVLIGFKSNSIVGEP